MFRYVVFYLVLHRSRGNVPFAAASSALAFAAVHMGKWAAGPRGASHAHSRAPAIVRLFCRQHPCPGQRSSDQRRLRGPSVLRRCRVWPRVCPRIRCYWQPRRRHAAPRAQQRRRCRVVELFWGGRRWLRCRRRCSLRDALEPRVRRGAAGDACCICPRCCSSLQRSGAPDRCQCGRPTGSSCDRPGLPAIVCGHARSSLWRWQHERGGSRGCTTWRLTSATGSHCQPESHWRW